MSRSRAVAIAVLAIVALAIAAFALTRGSDGPDQPSANPGSQSPTTEPSTSGQTSPETSSSDPSDDESATSAAVPTESTSPGASPSSGQTTPSEEPDDTEGTAPETPVGDDRAAGSLCALAPAEVEQLAELGESDEIALESLRDAIPLLDARLSELVAASEGRPELDEPVQLLDEVLHSWRVALSASDEGDAEAARSALQDSRTTLEQVERAVTEASSEASLTCD